MHQLTVQQAREQFDQSSALMDPGLDEPLARVETLFVPARDGTPLPARLYSPQGCPRRRRCRACSTCMAAATSSAA